MRYQIGIKRKTNWIYFKQNEQYYEILLVGAIAQNTSDAQLFIENKEYISS